MYMYLIINMSLSYVFKLADFGTARELGPEETFISLYGTEEYLFPGLYERALVNPGNKTKFSAKVCKCTCRTTAPIPPALVSIHL